MTITEERKEFSARLMSALRRARYVPDSPTVLARHFNEIYPGRPITVHAARKWLVAQAIPTQDKLRALASWLDVPADWLRFGTLAESTPLSAQKHTSEVIALLARMTRDEVSLVEDLHVLEHDERDIVREMILLFLKRQNQAKETFTVSA
jgi:transcriptional regulator with XRE-family HTH domain